MSFIDALIDALVSIDVFFVGVTFGIIVVLVLITTLIEHFFPKPTIVKRIEKITQWIIENIIP